MLVTLSDRLARIEARLAQLELTLQRVSAYAESTERMNHAAISRLSSKLLGQPWPGKD